MSSDDYHSDPVIEPSLSSSIGRKIIARSPLHGKVGHPRIAEPDELVRDHRSHFDLGSVAHSLLLGRGQPLAVVDRSSWQGNIAGLPTAEWREKIREAGQIPILRHQYERTCRMVEKCRFYLDQGECSKAFRPDVGKSEQVIIWREKNGVWCRIMVDWLPDDRTRLIAYDYKTTRASAHPEDWGGKTAWGMQFDFQAAFYIRGMKALFGGEPRIRFVVQELSRPHALCVVELTPQAVAMAMRKVEMAIEMFKQCREQNQWPSYPLRVCYVDPPAYEESKWLEREEREPISPDMVERMTDFVRPL